MSMLLYFRHNKHGQRCNAVLNITSNVESICSTIKVYPGDAHLSLLPLHHTFENTVGFLFMVYSGVVIAYCDGIKYAESEGIIFLTGCSSCNT